MEATIRPMMSPLQLDKYFLKELYFGLHEGFDRGRVHEDSFTIPKLQVGVVAVDRNPDNPLQWRFEVSLELLEPEDGEFPYKVAARVVGYFTVNESLPSERVERLARTNGPALLYSSAREIVASITGRSSFPPLLIPSVFFAQSEDNEAKPAVKQLPPAKETRGKAAKKASKKGAKKGASKKGKK